MFHRLACVLGLGKSFPVRPEPRAKPRRLHLEPLETRLVPARLLADAFVVVAEVPRLVSIFDPISGQQAGIVLG